MSFAPFPPPSPPPPPAEKRPRRFSRTQKAVMAGGLAAGLALGGAGISYAASSGSSSTTTPPNTNTPNTPAKPGHGPRPFGRGPGGFGAFGGLGGLGGVGRALYGSVTVQTGTGKYQTIVFQVGTAQSAGSSAASSGLTVKSADGHTQKYSVNSSTRVNAQLNGISSVKAGDQVEVIANGSDLALRIVDTTGLKNGRAGLGFGPAGSPPGQPKTAEAGAF